MVSWGAGMSERASATEKAPKPKMPDAEKRRLTRFYLIAFAWTWALWIPALVWSARTGIALPTMEAGYSAWSKLSGVGLLLAVAFQLAVYGPLIAAFLMLVSAKRASREGDGDSANASATEFRDWKASLVKFRVAPGWWAFVLLWPLALAVLVTLAGTILGGGMPRFSAGPVLGSIPLLFAIQFVTSGMEEPGWRGFALPLLQRTHSADNASWYLGLAWAAWHLPYMVYLNRAAPMWTLPLTLAGFTMAIIAMGYVHAWVYNSTGSVLLNIVLHAWANVTNGIVAMIQPSPLMGVATAVFTWLFVAWLTKRYGKERLAVE